MKKSLRVHRDVIKSCRMYQYDACSSYIACDEKELGITRGKLFLENEGLLVKAET